MLAAVHSPEAIRAIQDALHSGAERSYANAVEALDVLVASPLSELLPPLFDARLTQADFVRIGNEKLTIEKSSANTTIMALLNSQSTPWFRVITMFALGEMGAKVNKRSRRNPLDLLDGDKPADTPLFSRDEIQVMLGAALVDSDPNVRVASRAARRILEGEDVLQAAQTTEEHVLSLVERIIFLKGVPFFAEMTVNQLAIVATVCEEELFKEDTVIFGENTPGGTLYVVVSGNVGIERQDKATRTSARLRTVEAKSYFGESTFFNNSPTTTSAIAIQNTFVLRLRYEPLVALMQEYPDLSLRLIEVLSQRIRKSREKLADLSRQDQDDVKKVLDKLG
jgi:CRP-like cAMP-binding protein